MLCVTQHYSQYLIRRVRVSNAARVQSVAGSGWRAFFLKKVRVALGHDGKAPSGLPMSLQNTTHYSTHHRADSLEKAFRGLVAPELQAPRHEGARHARREARVQGADALRLYNTLYALHDARLFRVRLHAPRLHHV